MTKEQTIILPEDEGSAKLVTVTGWVSRDGRYYGNDEDLARWTGATHRKCDNCGTPTPKTGYTICTPCRRESEFERWKNLESEEYVGQFVYSGYLDEYFFNRDDLFVRIEDLLVDEEIESTDELMLVNLRPTKYCQIDFDLWIDYLPEDGEIDPELAKKIDELNKFIDTLPPISYLPGNKRIVGININDGLK